MALIVEKITFKGLEKIISILSFSSLCAYLFHRQIYGIISKASKLWLGDIYFWEIPIMLGVLFVVSYYMQRCYEKIMNKFN